MTRIHGKISLCLAVPPPPPSFFLGGWVQLHVGYGKIEGNTVRMSEDIDEKCAGKTKVLATSPFSVHTKLATLTTQCN